MADAPDEYAFAYVPSEPFWTNLIFLDKLLHNSQILDEAKMQARDKVYEN